jgi:hypothetical protein
MGMCIDQAGQYPALGNEFGTGHRIRGPTIAVGVKIDRLTFGKSETAHSQYCHNTTPHHMPPTVDVQDATSSADRSGQQLEPLTPTWRAA